MQQKIELCRLDLRNCITNLAWFGSVVPAIFGLQIIIQFCVAAVHHFVELLAHCWWGCMVFIAFSHCVLEWVSFITQTCYHSILLTYPRSSINSPQTFSSVQFNWITYCLLVLLCYWIAFFLIITEFTVMLLRYSLILMESNQIAELQSGYGQDFDLDSGACMRRTFLYQSLRSFIMCKFLENFWTRLFIYKLHCSLYETYVL